MNDQVKEILKEGLKEEGLDLLEDVALRAFKVVLKKFPQLAAATDNKIDDAFVPVVAFLQPPILEAIDKINGKKDIAA